MCRDGVREASSRASRGPETRGRTASEVDGDGEETQTEAGGEKEGDLRERVAAREGEKRDGEAVRILFAIKARDNLKAITITHGLPSRVRAPLLAIARGLTLPPPPARPGLGRGGSFCVTERVPRGPVRALSGPHRATRPIFAALRARLPVTSASSRRCRGGRNSRREIIRRGPSEKLRGRSPSSTHGRCYAARLLSQPLHKRNPVCFRFG